jgi:hypothetical protein
MQMAERKLMRSQLLAEADELFRDHFAAGEWGRLLVFLQPHELGQGWTVSHMDVEEIFGDEHAVDKVFQSHEIFGFLPVVAELIHALASLDDVDLGYCTGATFLRIPEGLAWMPGLVRTPSSAFDTWLNEAIDRMQAMGEDLSRTYELASYERSNVDIERGRITFYSQNRPNLLAHGRLIGTYSQLSHTWQWAWANQSLPAQLREAARRLCDALPQREMWEITTQQFATDEQTAWGLCALVVVNQQAKGVYRAPIADGALYWMVDEVVKCGEEVP